MLLIEKISIINEKKKNFLHVQTSQLRRIYWLMQITLTQITLESSLKSTLQ